MTSKKAEGKPTGRIMPHSFMYERPSPPTKKRGEGRGAVLTPCMAYENLASLRSRDGVRRVFTDQTDIVWLH